MALVAPNDEQQLILSVDGDDDYFNHYEEQPSREPFLAGGATSAHAEPKPADWARY
jgi:hypothetical protein